MTRKGEGCSHSHEESVGTPRWLSRREVLGGLGAAAVGFAVGYKLRRRPWTGLTKALIRKKEFNQRANAIFEAHRKQTSEQVAYLKTKYEKPVFGKVRVWELIEKLGQCIDTTDSSMGVGSQYLHVQQTLAAMEESGVTDPNMLLIALLHDLGKIFLLTDEVPENILCPARRLNECEPGSGLDSVTYQFGHGELIYSRIKDHVPEAVAWTTRYHNMDISDSEHFMNATDKTFTENYLRTFQDFDAGHKSTDWVPAVKMEPYRNLVDEFFPQPILF